MRSLVAKFVRGNRRKVITVLTTTRAEAECAVRHVRSAPSDLPIEVWCAQEAEALAARQALLTVWPALTIVAWTGRAGSWSFKLLPFLIPPFRVLVLNEAGDFFPGRPIPILRHNARRTRDAGMSVVHWISDQSRWLAWRTGERIGDLMNWAMESLLATLAFVAQYTTPEISRFAVGRLRNRQSFALAFDAARDSSFIEVVLPNRAWPRRLVIQALLSSDATFLVLRRRGEADSADVLIELARKTNAFAVAKQTAHSNWRKRVVTKHPFRRLQPGEVTQVLAPCSSLMVLRRDTLLRLGCPRALTWGAALLLIFWKSSAAGLRTLVAGHSDEISDEPDMALEDAELALQVTLSRQLPRLGPRHPARYRGNVAWSPSHSLEGRGKPRVLIVSPYLPFPLSHGGAVRIYNLCRALSRDVDFVLACFREADQVIHYPELHEVFREVYIIDADEKHCDDNVPARVLEYRNNAMSDLITMLCRQRRVDLVQLEYTQMAEYRDQTGAVPVLLVEHDITFALFRQLADSSGDIRKIAEYQRWVSFEREALQCSNLVWTMSAEDRKLAIEHGAPRRRTYVIPNGVDPERFRPVTVPSTKPVVLFVGAFRHLPNLLAFETLKEVIMPAVWRECPDAVLHVIAGLNHERAIETAGKSHLLAPDSRIRIEGFVEDVRPAYTEATVVVAPLPVSAGTNIKLPEAMACGRAIVSTPVGCYGLDLIDSRELIIASLGAPFAAAVVSLLQDRELREQIGREARRTAERRFAWNRAAQDALRSYAELIEVPVRTAVQ